MISIVIATRDRAAFLARALRSLAAQRGAPAFEIVVADNGSSDETAAVAQRAGVRRVFVPVPNRAKARNAALAVAAGETVLFVDDDVVVPEHFVGAHARAHERASGLAVSGPIVNVPSYEVRPRPSSLNGSRAFFCTCNVSVSRHAVVAAGGFDEAFDLYGWEDTELGVRLRRSGIQRAFSWDAYLWHIKPPEHDTLEVRLRKSVEKARMAAQLLARDGDWRLKLATGGYRANLVRAQLTAPEPMLPWMAAVALSRRTPSSLRSLAEATLLDGVYAHELRRALRPK